MGWDDNWPCLPLENFSTPLSASIVIYARDEGGYVEALYTVLDIEGSFPLFFFFYSCYFIFSSQVLLRYFLQSFSMLLLSIYPYISNLFFSFFFQIPTRSFSTRLQRIVGTIYRAWDVKRFETFYFAATLRYIFFLFYFPLFLSTHFSHFHPYFTPSLKPPFFLLHLRKTNIVWSMCGQINS